MMDKYTVAEVAYNNGFAAGKIAAYKEIQEWAQKKIKESTETTNKNKEA